MHSQQPFGAKII